MRFAVLGNVEVHDATGPVTIAAPKQRQLLAVLLCRRGRPVPTASLIELLWHGDPPSSARKALSWHVSKTREAIGRDRIRFGAGGYELAVTDDEVDAERFRDLVRRADAAAETDPAAADRLLVEALALWQGEAFGELAEFEPMRQTARELSQLRLRALEAHGDIGLRLGDHVRLVPELTALVDEHPYREGFRTQLMLALYRGGRRSEALTVYRDGRRLLVEELGLELTEPLRRLHRQILAGDPELDPAVAATPTAPASAVPVPRQLPADSPAFTGRDAEVAALLDAATGTLSVAAIDGMAGIGKTTLAVHIGHRLASRFPDGQLFIDLHGFSGEIPAVTPTDALNRLLRTLGVADTDIPGHVDDRAALFRTVLSGSRVLLILDNAATEAQVRPLLPGGDRQLTLITSRRRLLGIDDAVTVNLDVLRPEAAVALFRHTGGLGDLSAVDTGHVEEIVRLCGRLPLAIRLAAYQLRRSPSWTVAELRRRLSRQPRVLATLSIGQRSVAAAFELSYQELDESARRAFRLLSGYPGPHLDGYDAAAILDVELDAALDLLDTLFDANLLDGPVPGRFGFHDLLRQFAIAESETVDGPAARDRALARLLDSLCHSAHRCSTRVDPHIKYHAQPPPRPAFAVPDFDSAEAGLSWYDVERPALAAMLAFAVDTRRDTRAWQLTHAMDTMADLRGHVWARYEANRLALTAARRLADPQTLALALNNLGNAQRSLSDPAAAIASFTEALGIRGDIDDIRGQATVLNNIGITYRHTGELVRAAQSYREAIRRCREIGDEPLEALVISNYVGIADRLERYDSELELLDRAREIFTRFGNERQLARVDHGYGTAYLSLGEPHRALEYDRRALVYCERVDERFGTGDVLNNIAIALRQLGRHADALRHHQRVVAIGDELGDPSMQARNLTDRGLTLLRAGQTEAAMADFGRAREHAAGIDDRFELARARRALADGATALGDSTAARVHLDAAIELYEEIGIPSAAALRQRRDAPAAAVVEVPRW